MSDNIFIDTNILVYAHDLDVGDKHKEAQRIVSELWERKNGVLSTQVLQELYVTLTKKVLHPIEKVTARRMMQRYFAWQVIINDPVIIMWASDIEEAYNLSFWDALIVSAAYAKNVTTILTEDLSPGQYIEGILIQNPFISQ
jgi:predicted nucleic acid-binding protein